MGAFIRLGSNYPLSAPLRFLAARGGGGAGDGRVARRVWRWARGLDHRGRKPKPRHVSRRVCMSSTRRHRTGCTWPLRRTGGSNRYHGEHGTRDWGLWASRTALLPLDSHRRRHPSACAIGARKRPSGYVLGTRRALLSEPPVFIVSFAHRTDKD